MELYDSALSVASEISIESHETQLIDSSGGDGFQFVGCIRGFHSSIQVQTPPTWVRRHFLGEAL